MQTERPKPPAHAALARPILTTLLVAFAFAIPGEALAYGVAEGDKGYIQEISGVHLMSFLYLGAKRMVTGYDHILFLLGVIFFLSKAIKNARHAQPAAPSATAGVVDR